MNMYVPALMVSVCNSLPWCLYLAVNFVENCQVLVSYVDLLMANSKNSIVTHLLSASA